MTAQDHSSIGFPPRAGRVRFRLTIHVWFSPTYAPISFSGTDRVTVHPLPFSMTALTWAAVS